MSVPPLRYTLNVWSVDPNKVRKHPTHDYLVTALFAPAIRSWICSEFFEIVQSQFENKPCIIIPNHNGFNDSGVPLDDTQVLAILDECKRKTRTTLDNTTEPLAPKMKIRSYMAGTPLTGTSLFHSWDFLVIFTL